MTPSINKKLYPLSVSFKIILLGLLWGAGIVFAYNNSNYTLVSARSFHDPVAMPYRLMIPEISVDSPIEGVGVDQQGNMAVPSDAVHVAWYKYSSRPGATGVAVINGHMNTKYAPQAIFYKLDELERGDEIKIKTADAQILVFRVTHKKEYPYDTPTEEIFLSQSETSKVNLITCSGEWLRDKKTYSKRLVVFTERVE